MESTALIAPLPLLTSRSRSKPLSPASIRARRPASIPFSYGRGRVVLFSRRGRVYAGVGSLVSAAAATGEAADGGSEAILLSVQVHPYDRIPTRIRSSPPLRALFSNRLFDLDGWLASSGL